jgi:hypothetical protein
LESHLPVLVRSWPANFEVLLGARECELNPHLPLRQTAEPMPPQQRERYNSRARNSTAGGSSHKKRARGAQSGPMSGVLAVEDGHDDSMDIIIPKTLQEKEEDRKRKLKEEVRTSHS